MGSSPESNSPVKAVVAVDQAYAGWALTDEILRLMTGSGPVNETFPSRLFTRQNINSIPVTTAAQATGQWFGNTSYQPFRGQAPAAETMASVPKPASRPRIRP